MPVSRPVRAQGAVWKVRKEVGVIVEAASLSVGWWEREDCGGCGCCGGGLEMVSEEAVVVVCCTQGRAGSAGAWERVGG